MPMDRSKYPRDWEAISRRVRDAAGNRCQWCRVRNYAVGTRDADGGFSYVAGNIYVDDMQYTGSYSEARAVADSHNENREGGPRAVVVVLTVAHLNHDTTDNSDANLAALCNRCHNRHDVGFRRGNRRATALAKKAAGDLFEAEGVPAA